MGQLVVESYAEQERLRNLQESAAAKADRDYAPTTYDRFGH